MPPYEIIDHTADYAVRATGGSLAALIEGAAAGMIALTIDTAGLAPTEVRTISAEGDQAEDLILRTLRELLYLTEDEGLVAVEFSVDGAGQGRVTGKAGCVRLGEVRDRLLGQIKAVTYHDLAIREVGGGLEVVVVFDT